MPAEPTVTTVELAKEVGLTGKSIRLAIHRGDLFATRIRKGSGRTASATEFVIQRSDADDWKARRAARKVGIPGPTIEEAQAQRRQANGHAYFLAQDGEGERNGQVERLKRDALNGSEAARERLREDWQRGGVSLLRWWRRGIGEIIAQGPER